MSDVRKAAILISSLPEEQAAQLLSKLTPKQVEVVSIEIAKLGRLTASEQEGVIQDFASSNPNAVDFHGGGLQLASSLVEKALGKDAAATLENVKQSIQSRPFAFLKKVDPQNLLTFILDEHPQTIALVLSHLNPTLGAEVVKGLPPEKQLQVIRRIANMSQTNPEVIHEVEQGLERRMSNLMGQSFETAGGVNSVAEILNVSDRATERTLLESLGQEDPELVDEIRRLMFVFDDLAKLSDKDIQAVLKNVETNQWAMALKGASADLKRKVLGNMSQRAAQSLQEEMEFLGPKKLSEVEQVQQKIVDIVRTLEDAGQIAVHAAGEESEQLVA